MSSRTAKVASAIFASLILGAPLATVSHSAAGADDECLSSPKTSQGGHWYYRIDRVTKRHCWYLKEDDEKLSQAATKPVSPKTAPPIQRSVADARAELPSQGRIEQPNQGNRLTSADVAVSAVNRDAKPPVAEIPQTVVASRWMGQSEADSSNNSALLTSPTPLASPMPSSSVPGSSVPRGSVSNGPMANKDDSDTNVSAAAPARPPSPLGAGQFAVDLSSATSAYPVQMLLAAMMGALALAGLLGRVIFKFVGPRRPANRRGRRGAIWKSAAPGGRAASRVYPGADALPPRPDFPRDLDEVRDPDDRIAELLRDYSRKGRNDKKQRQPSVGLFP
jgi:hypothetical protein